jgi:ribose transport system substrate-binding protein
MNRTVVQGLGLVVVAAVIVVVAVLAGRQKGEKPSATQTPSAAPTPPGSEMRFALVPKSVGHPYWEGVREGMEAAAQEAGVKAIFHGPSAANIDEQIRIIEDFITQGYDGIGISPNDPNTVKEVIKRAMDKGIAVVTFDSDSPDSDRLLYIGTDNREAGRVGGREMARLLGAKPKAEASGELLVQIIGGMQGAWNLNERIAGFKEAVEGSSIRLCDVLFNEENPDTSLRVAEDAITTHSGLRGFFCSNAFGGPGVARAIKGALQRGKAKQGQIRVVAFDTTEDILNYIEEGIIGCTLAQETRKMGGLSVERLVEFARQHKQQGKFERPPKGKDVIDTGVKVVRPEDVKDYRTKPAAGKGK